MPGEPIQEKIPTNYQLSVQMLQMDNKLDRLIDGKSANKKWQKAHEEAEKAEFVVLHKRVSRLQKYYRSISLVSGFCGACIVVAIDWTKKHL